MIEKWFVLGLQELSFGNDRCTYVALKEHPYGTYYNIKDHFQSSGYYSEEEAISAIKNYLDVEKYYANLFVVKGYTND